MRYLIGDRKWLLVDEAQKIRNVGNMLKIVADKFKDVSVIITGSSSFKLADTVNESLTGRKREFRLYPLSFKEMVIRHCWRKPGCWSTEWCTGIIRK